ncbi:glycosyltransferase [Solihabitans fulvus]|uniref:Glycosyltransferase n=1 Tax=Solihabitans fulvus TaxID=1892852 RepID=A0A5B2W320_9PSEU|nr:glycosyltransferase [Solihabitans fulvus]KAA2246011.1 glycosyltransferase [Solihabitans fulvus]
MTDVPASGDQCDARPTTVLEADSQPLFRACTVATRAELPAVRVLSSSFLANHPGARFDALIIDALPGDALIADAPGAAEPGDAKPGDTDPKDTDLLTPLDIGVSEAELAGFATGCTAEQLRAVLRPRLLTHLLADGLPVLCLDPWVQVLGPVTDQVVGATRRSPLVLLPRVLRPLPDDGLRPGQEDLVDVGLYDPGFIVVGPTAAPFLSSWTDEAARNPETAAGFLDSAPALTDHKVLRDARVGLSVWNAGQRQLHRDADGRLTTLGEPLLTVHFAGFDPQRPWLLSADFADRPRTLLSEHPLVADLCTGYRADLVRAGHTNQPTEYRFGQLTDGTALPDGLRADYRDACLAAARAGDRPPPAAFADDRDAAFLAWACEPLPDQPASTRWSAAVWRDDPWLRRQFPDPFGANGTAFREWCAGVGVAAGRLPVDAVPGPVASDPDLLPQLGLSVLGSGPVAALVLAAARASGLPISTEPGYPVVLRCAEPGAQPPVPADRYLVGVGLDLISADEVPGAQELWVASDGTRTLLERAGGPPVRVLHLPVVDRGERDAEAMAEARELLDVPSDAVVFACAADHSAERAGNTLGAVSAFLAAFPERQDVRLLVSVTGASAQPEAAERLRLATSADPRVRLFEDTSDEVRHAVLDTADCAVSLHRCGSCDRIAVTLAEAAARGVPVLTSAHGAVAEVFDGDSAILVPCNEGGAEPDIQAAAQLLRGLADDPGTAAAIGAAGRAHVLRVRAVSRAGDQLRERVEHAYRSWRARRAATKPARDVDPLRPLRAAKHALLRQPDVDVASRTPGAPALRKVVLRVLDHYDNHIRDVLNSLVDGVERTATELVRRQDEIRDGGGLGELDVLRAELEQLVDQQSQLGDQLVGADDAVVRVRADMAGQGRRLREAEDAVVAEAAKRNKQLDVMAQRIDRLTMALDRTLDRIDSLESRVVDVLRERDSRLDAGVRAATQALQTTDALRRVVVREHERHSDPVDGVRSSLVLCDAGLLRLPAEDALMLPLLSSNGVWETKLSELIDSLVEPDGIFLDVGAYIGYHTIRVLSRLGTSGAVVAVEPCESARKLLRHNVDVNVPARIADRLVVVDAAAWDSQAELVAEPALSGGVTVSARPESLAEVAPGPTGAGESDQDGTLELSAELVADATPTVRGNRLDRELEDVPALQGMRLSVVRVDAPGRGHRALAGLVRLLRRDRPHVFLEFSATATVGFGDDPVTVLREFRMWGYELLLLGAVNPSTPEEVVEALGASRSVTLWLRPKTKVGSMPSPSVSSPLRQPADQAI